MVGEATALPLLATSDGKNTDKLRFCVAIGPV